MTLAAASSHSLYILSVMAARSTWRSPASNVYRGRHVAPQMAIDFFVCVTNDLRDGSGINSLYARSRASTVVVCFVARGGG